MNLTLMKAFWRERFTSWIRMLLLLSLWGFNVLLHFTQRPVTLPEANLTALPILIIGAGVIGRDLSTGVLQLILARPVGRAEYVLSRWVGLALTGLFVMVLGWLLALPFALSTGGVTWPHALGSLVEYLFAAFGLAAVVTGFSALLPGFGDLALLVMGGTVSGLLTAYAKLSHHAWAGRVSSELIRTLIPQIQLKDLMVDGTPHFYPLAVWGSAVTLSLLLGIWAMNRKELSYATAG